MKTTQEKIQFKNIDMKFGDFYANKNVSFDVKENEVHSILGENGAGKSTLMSVLFGLYNQTNGEILINGHVAKIKNPRDAAKFGISMLPQHFKLVDNLSVWENVIIGNETSKFGFVISKREALKKLEETTKKYNIKIDLKEKVYKLSTSDKQKVELLKMLWKENDILIFDEPTSILTPIEIEQFLKMIKDLQKAGKTILLITHKLEEIREVADRCTILRKGQVVKTVPGKTVASKLAELMVGQSIDLNMGSIERKKTSKGDEKLLVRELSFKSKTEASSLSNINLSVNAGEILGIAAVEGNGQSELFQILAGIIKQDQGDVYLSGHNVNKESIKHRYFKDGKNVLSHIPEDRHKHGLFLDKTPAMNSIIQNIDEFKGLFGMLNNKKINSHFKKIEKEFDVRGVISKRTIARDLSGGNQQKLIIGRELSRDAEIVLAVHPTRGLDMGAIRNVYEKLIDKRNNGAAVVLYSGELDEVLQVSDRVIVLNHGKIVGEFKGKFDKNKIGLLMLDKGAK